MSTVAGLTLGIGLFLIWWSCWALPPRAGKLRRPGKLVDLLAASGVSRVSPAGLIASSGILGTLVLLVVWLLTGSLVIGACFGVFACAVPVTAVRWQARRRSASLLELWPDAVDHLRSAIRAGLSLPEALIQLGENGPEELRAPFREFGADYRAGGQFDEALGNLKERLADPVGDRIVEALRITRQVGGSDLGRLLGTLAEFLRENARTRSELLARQSWTINAARLAVAAPWIVLMLMATRPEAVAAYNTPSGAGVLVSGMVISVVCYRLMLRIGALPPDERVLR
ncbi:type II secretion system F family protein [Arthrobacter sp. Sa2BUA2]|uniref:Type II secretion system F family protein n=1 Tax=Arthrobacter pullicola TaxID=2762224 RepID=A0ABR8YJ30_9MICC|nr:type II secretion system F family protein [Arthrobacter pullicola]MBD8044220.1 type II secretion system F family protein [Arthrobacter pullicola]